MIVSASGRALAASARRGGLQAVVLDLFDDLDTRVLALGTARCADRRGSFSRALLLHYATALAPVQGYGALVVGSGLEGRPGVLSALARVAPLAGNDSAAIGCAKDPGCFFALLDELDIAHPDVSLDAPQPLQGWLRKRRGGAGGAHVCPAELGEGRAGRHYYQRHMNGEAMSVLFLADGHRAQRINVHRLRNQWLSARQPFAYGGAVTLPAVDAALLAVLDGLIGKLTAALSLRGLNGIDFILGAHGVSVLELNPRPTATLALSDEGVDGGLLKAHLAACAGQLPAPLTPAREARAQIVLWAPQARVVPAFDWPDWVSDVPAPGQYIRARRPLCSITANAASADAAEALASSRCETLWDALRNAAGAVPGRASRVATARASHALVHE